MDSRLHAFATFSNFFVWIALWLLPTAIEWHPNHLGVGHASGSYMIEGIFEAGNSCALNATEGVPARSYKYDDRTQIVAYMS